MYKFSYSTMLVRDQQEAVNFYTKKLGFKVHIDVAYKQLNWISLYLDESGLELIQILAVRPEEKELVGRQAATLPFLILTTHNFEHS